MLSLDDKRLAEGDVIHRPEISDGETEAATRKAATASAGGEVAADPEADERAARLLTNEFAAAFRNVTGEDVDANKAQALEEISAMIFSGLRRLSYGGYIRGGIMAACLVAPFIPALWRLFRPQQAAAPQVQKNAL